MSQPAWLVWNTHAGSHERFSLDRVRKALEARYDLRVAELARSDEANAAVRQALERGAEVVIAAGGDGTVSAVASELVHRDAALGVIPMGTANAVARALGIPLDEEGACETLCKGTVRTIDTATVDGQRVLELCSIGLHAEAIVGASSEDKRRFGPLAYLRNALSEMNGLENFEVELQTGVATYRGQATTVAVSNIAPPTTVVAQTGGPVCPEDGLLSVSIIAASGGFDFAVKGLSLLTHALLGREPSHDDIGFFRTSSVRITTTPPRRVVIDGEEAGTTPIEVTSDPQSLKIITPP